MNEKYRLEVRGISVRDCQMSSTLAYRKRSLAPCAFSEQLPASEQLSLHRQHSPSQ